jgi:Phosphodiester glycosidase
VRRRPLVILAVAGLVVLAACASPPSHSAASTSRPSHPSQSTSTTAPPASTDASTTTTGPPAAPPGQPPWAPVASDAAGLAVEERTYTAPSGHSVTLVRFDAGATVFDLHIGSTDPPANLAALPQDRGPRLATDELPFLLAAFNGGFKMNAGQGGVQLEGQTIAPLVNGMASFVIDQDGTAHVGVWGSGLPKAGEAVLSVRQNQPPLIENGALNPTVDNPSTWGATITAVKVVPRSAVGEDAQGDIVFAGGMALVPADLAAALQNAGAVNAMQLDINPEWVQLDTAPAPGAPLTIAIPGQNRPADQYVAGWTRDFIVVMGRVAKPSMRPR